MSEVRSAIDESGSVRVFEDGTVFKICKDGSEVPAKLHICTYGPSQGKGYCQVYLSNIRKMEYVHRLVAKAFIPNPMNKRCVNHKDGNTKNNCVKNLEWVTHKENTQHAFATKLIDPYRMGRRCELCGKPIVDRKSGDSCSFCERKHWRELDELHKRNKCKEVCTDGA